MDINYCLHKVTESEDIINKKRTNFDKFWAQLRASHELPPKRNRTRYLSLYNEIIDNISQQIREVTKFRKT
jgi:hypothetical protein